MTTPLLELVEILLGTLLLCAPLLVGLGLVLATNALATRGRVALLPLLGATAAAGVGIAVLLTADDGLGGVAEVLLGLYLLGAATITGALCATVLVVRRRQHTAAARHTPRT